MVYRLRHFENNYQIISSLGWTLVVIGIIVIFVGPLPGAIIFILIGAFLVWIQLRGKQIVVDTKAKTVKAGGKLIHLNSPCLIKMHEERMSQNVNSRVSTTNVKTYFYKCYVQDGEERILISCNLSEKRDKEKLQRIAADFSIPFQMNY